VVVGGVTVALGDWVVGDSDGVTVVAGAAVEAILDAGRAREQKESVMFEKLRGGVTTVELLGLDPSPVEVADL
jgi:4-hydroxy-4-methyl-2-oxoglutarate aldolase